MPEAGQEMNALQEISSIANSIAGSLDQVMQRCDKLGSDSDADLKMRRALYEASYGDPVFIKARQAVADMASEECSKGVAPRTCESNKNAEMKQVSDSMSQLHLESWASSVLRTVPTEECGEDASPGGGDEPLARTLRMDEIAGATPPQTPPPTLPAVNGKEEAEVVTQQSRRGSKSRPSLVPAEASGSAQLATAPMSLELSEGAAQAPDLEVELDVPRLQTAFRRFKVPDSGDLHKADLCELLRYLGHVMTEEEALDPLVKEVTLYEYLDFDEFLNFMEKYVPFEQEQFRQLFQQYDEDGSGTIELKELWQLLGHLGFMPLKGMLQEALEEVDSDASGTLNFDELCLFLRVYRAQEGFTKAEVKDLEASFKHFATAREGTKGESVALPGEMLAEALVKTFGLHIQSFALLLEKQLRSGQGLTTAASSSPVKGGKAEVLQFPEFLIFARKVREKAMEQLRSDFPAWAVTNSNQTAKDITSSQTAKDKDSFMANDTDGSGGISESELRRVLRLEGFTPLQQNMNEIFAEVVDGPWHPDRELDFNQFFGYMLVMRQREGFSTASVETMKTVFDRFDDDGSGEVNALELSELFRHLGYSADMDQIHVFVTQVDANDSGELDFREFLRLMRLHRETEMCKYQEAFDALKDSATLAPEAARMPSKKVFSALKQLELEPTATLRMMPQALPAEGLRFDAFVDIVDSSRMEFVEKQRKNASFGDERVATFRDFFNRFDKDGSGDIDQTELGGILRLFNWEPRSLEEQRELLRKLNTARARAREAGIKTSEDGASTICFWTFLQLARMLETEQEHVEEARLHRLMEELNFENQEVAQFREIYMERKQEIMGSGTSPTAAMKPGQVEPTGLSREAIRKLMRILVVTVNPNEKVKLDEQLKGLLNDEMLDFHNFLRLMRWLLDTDFAGINSRLAKKVEAKQAPTPSTSK